MAKKKRPPSVPKAVVDKELVLKCYDQISELVAEAWNRLVTIQCIINKDTPLFRKAIEDVKTEKELWEYVEEFDNCTLPLARSIHDLYYDIELFHKAFDERFKGNGKESST